MIEILTKYVKNKVKELSFDNTDDRKYIKDLLYIEHFLSIPGSQWGFAGAMGLKDKENAHPKEYDEIFKELDPECFKRALKRRKRQEEKEKKEDKEWREIEDKKTKEFKEAWKNAGGK